MINYYNLVYLSMSIYFLNNKKGLKFFFVKSVNYKLIYKNIIMPMHTFNCNSNCIMKFQYNMLYNNITSLNVKSKEITYNLMSYILQYCSLKLTSYFLVNQNNNFEKLFYIHNYYLF